MSLQRKIVGAIAALTIAAFSLTACSGGQDSGSDSPLTSDGEIPEGVPTPTQEQLDAWSQVSGEVYFITPGAISARWENFDVPYVKEALAKYAPEAELVVLAGNDQDAQQKAFDAAAASDAAGILFAVGTANLDSAGMLQQTVDAGIPVITYAHDIFDVPLDPETGEGAPQYHVGVNLIEEYMVPACESLAEDAEAADEPMKVAYLGLGSGSAIGHAIHTRCMEFVQPAVDSGAIELVCNDRLDSFDPAEYQKLMEQCLTKTSGEVDAVLTHNDDVIGGVVAALVSQGLAGQVPVYGGYDATLEGIQRVVAGWQTIDTIQPSAQEAYLATMMILSEISGSAMPEGFPNGAYWNGEVLDAGEPGIPAAILSSVRITSAEDVEEYVEDVFYTKEQICSPDGVAVDSDYCSE